MSVVWPPLAERQAEFCSYFLPAYPLKSSAAIGGNGTQENLCRPTTEGAKDHGSDGVLQWRLERLDGPDGLKAFAGRIGVPWDTLKAQALFTMHELDQPQYVALKADLKASVKSLETLTLNFCDAFERPSAAGRAEKERIRYANDCLAILMRGVPIAQATIPSPTSTLPPVGDLQMPIELILQLVAPLAESLVAGLLKGVLTHVQQTGTMQAVPERQAPEAPVGLPPIDFAELAKLIAAEIAALNQHKPAA